MKKVTLEKDLFIFFPLYTFCDYLHSKPPNPLEGRQITRTDFLAFKLPKDYHIE